VSLWASARLRRRRPRPGSGSDASNEYTLCGIAFACCLPLSARVGIRDASAAELTMPLLGVIAIENGIARASTG